MTPAALVAAVAAAWLAACPGSACVTPAGGGANCSVADGLGWFFEESSRCCTLCSPGFYCADGVLQLACRPEVLEYASGFGNRACSLAAPCAAGQYAKRVGTRTAPQLCSTVRVCRIEEEQTAAPTPTSDRVCRCRRGEYVGEPPDCAACSAFMPHCQRCTNESACDACADAYVLANASTCLPRPDASHGSASSRGVVAAIAAGLGALAVAVVAGAHIRRQRVRRRATDPLPPRPMDGWPARLAVDSNPVYESAQAAMYMEPATVGARAHAPARFTEVESDPTIVYDAAAGDPFYDTATDTASHDADADGPLYDTATNTPLYDAATYPPPAAAAAAAEDEGYLQVLAGQEE